MRRKGPKGLCIYGEERRAATRGAGTNIGGVRYRTKPNTAKKRTPMPPYSSGCQRNSNGNLMLLSHHMSWTPTKLCRSDARGKNDETLSPDRSVGKYVNIDLHLRFFCSSPAPPPATFLIFNTHDADAEFLVSSWACLLPAWSELDRPRMLRSRRKRGAATALPARLRPRGSIAPLSQVADLAGETLLLYAQVGSISRKWHSHDNAPNSTRTLGSGEEHSF